MPAVQNDVGGKFLDGSDLAGREDEVLRDASLKLGFSPKTIVGRSSWWGSQEIGAFHYHGLYQGKPAVLKIQGVMQATSEIFMIQQFVKKNRSKVVRPPYLYAYQEWND